jgi:hypothetical protein
MGQEVNWIEVALIAAVLTGLVAGGVLAAQRPSFWLGLGTVMFRAALPFLLKRMPPEKEKEWRDCIRRGGEWDHVRKRCKQ